MVEIISIPEGTIVIRLLIATVLGMLVGAERIIAHKTAGMRTHSLVALGSALFVVISELVLGTHIGMEGNPTLMPAYIISGVGFLCTGLIIFRNEKLAGLTTASGLWVSAGIGMAAGFGFYTTALLATILILFIFTILWFVEQKLRKLPFVQDNTDKDTHDVV